MSTVIPSSDEKNIRHYIDKIILPGQHSHKGNNGKVLCIGGSSLFHGAVLWSAEMASHVVDMVHVASTAENNEIIRTIKTKWQSGMVISQKDIPSYAGEDGVILVGNGMMREEEKHKRESALPEEWGKVIAIKNEGAFTRACVHYLITHFPDKQFVFDAGALTEMDREWLGTLKKKPLLTPHQKEFQTLFGVDVLSMDMPEKIAAVSKIAAQHNCIILLKAVDDIVSDGHHATVITGGNAGLTKGGTGDVLAGLVSALSVHSDPFAAAVVGSYLLKKTADKLFSIKGYWYSVNDIISLLPSLFHGLTRQ